MITNADITIFNKILGADRRDVYVPTYIYGVSWYASHSDSRTGTSTTANSKYVVRIPITARIAGNKQFINADDFYDLCDQPIEVRDKFWTIQTGCFVVKGIVELDNGIDSVDEEEIMMLPNESFNVNSYADNTIRGTKHTKHWRIGGV